MWVRPPISPVRSGHRVDPPGALDAVVTLARAHGARFLDLTDLEMAPHHFYNDDHMTQRGRQRHTAALVEALRHEEAWSPGPNTPFAPSPTGVRGADGPGFEDLRALRHSWRVAAESETIHWRFSDAFSGAVRLRGEGGAPRIVVAGVELATRPTTGGWTSNGVVSARGRWRISVTGGAGGTLLRAVRLGSPPGHRDLVGYGPDLTGGVVDSLAPIEVFGGRLSRTHARPVALHPPPAVRLDHPLEVQHEPDDPSLHTIALPGFVWLSDAATRARSPRSAHCSPLRLLVDGTPTDKPNTASFLVEKGLHDALAHDLQRLVFRHVPPSTSAPSLSLDPERRCDGGVWVYPGDQLTLAYPPDRLLALRDGIGALTLSAVQMDPGPSVGLGIRVEADGRTVLDGQATGHTMLSLDHALDPTAEVTVHLEGPPDAWFLVHSAALREAGP